MPVGFVLRQPAVNDDLVAFGLYVIAAGRVTCDLAALIGLFLVALAVAVVIVAIVALAVGGDIFASNGVLLASGDVIVNFDCVIVGLFLIAMAKGIERWAADDKTASHL
jgi:uncharacterized membrane protein YphA (DoxX/SURF4 family)